MTDFDANAHGLAQHHVIVGAGEAGTRAALALRDAGARQVTLIGTEPDLPYERPPLSKPEGEGVTIRAIAASFDGIATRFGRSVVAIDRANRQVRLDDGETIGYDRLLLATGASPRRLPGDTHKRALTLRNRRDAEAIYVRALPGHAAVIVGAGLIGLELAAALRKRAMSVSVVEAAPRALGRVLPQALADEIVARHESEGVRLIFNARISDIGDRQVTLADGTTLAADLLIAAIGVTPETALAEAAGLACDNGIHIDAGLTTTDPAIFAAGDCAAIAHPALGRVRFETWRNACDQGAMVARAMLGESSTFTAQPWFWSDQYDVGIQMVGLHDPARQAVRRALPNGGWLSFELDEANALRAASGIAPGRGVARDIRLAEMLIERGVKPPAGALADPSISLKSLLPRG